MSVALLWIPFTIVAALGQVVRNAMQRQLTAPLGTAGATHVRFLFGLPFAIIILGIVLVVGGEKLSWPPVVFWLWIVFGALSQIVATALMLAAMSERSFVVTTAYLKTEGIQTAIFGFIFIGDRLTWTKIAAILIATAGVVVTGIRPGATRELSALRPMVLGLVAAAGFGTSAVGYRAAILSMPDLTFVTSASLAVACALSVQTLVLSLYLAVRMPGVLTKIMRLWKPSMLAGFLGAAASEFWFLGFALTAAANVRTLALIEVLFVQGISTFVMKQPVSRRELLGIALIVGGVLLLVTSS